MLRHFLRAAFASLAAGSLMAGCGGDGNPSAPPSPAASNEMPAAAVTSGSALEAFALGVALSDTTEPLHLDDVGTFPTSETQEPIALH